MVMEFFRVRATSTLKTTAALLAFSIARNSTLYFFPHSSLNWIFLPQDSKGSFHLLFVLLVPFYHELAMKKHFSVAKGIFTATENNYHVNGYEKCCL